MKKIDKLIIQAFLGPFILTFAVVVFILLTVQMMNYVDQIFGKDLSYIDLGILVMHFAIFQTPIAFPLSVMLASLMTFGNLGEHFELTAIKSAGISLVRAMQPVFIITLIVTIIAFFSNNYLVPRSALKAYSLLYDIRQKKPALDIEPGFFYGGIEKYKIKVDSKLSDGKTLMGVIIYNHTEGDGNRDVIIAESGKMYTINNDQYLKFELYNGSRFTEGKGDPARGRSRNYEQIGPLTRTFFKKSEIIFDLSSFGMSRTDEGLFASNRLMRNFNELNFDLDSLSDNIILAEGEVYDLPQRYFTYSKIKNNTIIPDEVLEVQLREDSIKRLQAKMLEEKQVAELIEDDSLQKAPKRDSAMYMKSYNKKKLINKEKLDFPEEDKIALAIAEKAKIKNKPSKVIKNKELLLAKKQLKMDNRLSDEHILEAIDKKYEDKNDRIRVLKSALATTKQAKSKLSVQNSRIEQLNKSYFEFDIQWHKMLATAIACLSMFLIGAPLGAIIKKGGLGFPVLVSILFFIIYYVISIGGEKYAKSGLLPVYQGVWLANFILFPIGIFFLRQAKNDARLFETDYYKVVISNFILLFKNKR